MRYRLLLFAPLLLHLLACSKQDSGPRLDLVGSTRYTSFDRTISTPGDTVTFKLYSDVRSADKPLKAVRIFVTYAPVKNPLNYPAGYDATKAPADPEFTFLDSTMPASAREFVLQTTINARTTSGREQWRFEAEDVDGNRVSRGFRLQLRNADSLRLNYHRYTAQLQAPGDGNRRSFLALLPGLTLPRYTVRTNAANQALIDLVYASDAAGIYLAAPNDPIIKHTKGWNRSTEFRNTGIDQNGFNSTDTEQELISAFGGASELTPKTRTGPIAKGRVYAFLTTEKKYGLLYVQDILTAPVPTVLLQVHITK
ncbi:hypothetical protein [Hymenobacter persicinus]|uniref:DUF5007 domain-containing protein n=1 Tax=Hymenobacter persicinus TaxID=2025506 RepID=A0A4Q5L9H6_9BACT|nr:hypothetical protein [Hymenobacter persicinus]RYU78413.1 hypothetical protein EWM57_14050 [Hymenobacter persicinus]